LIANILLLNKPWNPSQPMEDRFAHIDSCIEFAKHIDPISETTLVRSALTKVENNGLFHDEIRDWNKLKPENRTMKAFKANERTFWKLPDTATPAAPR
jgi:hypothetical protein